jgi:hypothetical protein
MPSYIDIICLPIIFWLNVIVGIGVYAMWRGVSGYFKK